MTEEKSREELEKILQDNWTSLRTKYPNVINIGIGTKIVNEKEEPCLVFYVTKKVEERFLTPKQIIPKEVEGVCTDVQPFEADFKVAATKPSMKPRKIQERIAGGVTK